MIKVIERIYRRTSDYRDPSQATTTANALDLLSSGIYTEEERFIFELLQNAVDSHDRSNRSDLSIKIVLTDNYLVFMHNGAPFSERDLEGLCDIGNGNKMTDAKKIGYKGIGFKSVFGLSQCVHVFTEGFCFKFDKSECEKIVINNGWDSKTVRMPWQIIPITSSQPIEIDTDGFTVATYIQISTKSILRKKVEKLLSDTRFLLFLNVESLSISFVDQDIEILSLSKKLENGVLSIFKNGIPQNKWLIKSCSVDLSPEVKELLRHDSKTPTKLKESSCMEISFGIALDENDNIIPLPDALIYTYLPTSFSFGFPFIVNANFITDAGRQQIAKDCEWNKFIFSQIPSLYLTWVKEEIAPLYDSWHRVLPPLTSDNDDISTEYSLALDVAIKAIPFVYAKDKTCHLVQDVIADEIGLSTALPKGIFNQFVFNEINDRANSSSIISTQIGRSLEGYGVSFITKTHLSNLLAQTNLYIKTLSDEAMVIFLHWLQSISVQEKTDFNRELSYSQFLPDENNDLTAPINLFFPSDYRDDNDVAASAKILKPELYKIMSTDMEIWLKELGIQEMSNLSVIKNVLCQDGAITKTNAIDIMRFIFNVNKKENIFDNISEYDLSNLKILTQHGRLLEASQLYLSDVYSPSYPIEKDCPMDVFVSPRYISSNDEIDDWAFFFKKLGVSDRVRLYSISYGPKSWVFRNLHIQRCIQKAKAHEYNTSWDGRKFYLGCDGNIKIVAKASPFLEPLHISNTSHALRFYSRIWSSIFSEELPSSNEDYILGGTGFGYIKQANLNKPEYLNTSFLVWIASRYRIIPASDGNLHVISEVLPNTILNQTTFGKFYPVLSIESEIGEPWKSRLPFKKELVLSEYLEILDQISQEDSKSAISENKTRINAIYERISDTFLDLLEGSQNHSILRNWGESHKILSTEEEFINPSELYLLSENLSGIDIENQVYHQKTLKNERFVALMAALGVNIVTSHDVLGIEPKNRSIEASDKSVLEDKIDFFTVLTSSDSFSLDSWSEAKQKMQDNLNLIRIYKVPAISICYGSTSFDKTTYADNHDLFYVGKFGMANQELLADSLLKLFGLNNKVKSIFLTILQMQDKKELKDYLIQKGYDVTFVSITESLSQTPQELDVTFGGEQAEYGGLTKDEMHSALEEAKDQILRELRQNGFDTENKVWDGWTCIDGVTKDGIEYPLVIRSNRGRTNTRLSAIDWNQLMKPNAMFVVRTDSGVGTIRLRDALKSKDNITIRFSSDNIDAPQHISEMANVFAYFKGMQIDFSSFVQPLIQRWQSFLAPEKETGELPHAFNSDNLLPD